MHLFSRLLRMEWGESSGNVGNRMTLNNFNSVSIGVSETHTRVNAHLIFIKKKIARSPPAIFIQHTCVPCMFFLSGLVLFSCHGSRWHEAVLMRLKGSSPLSPSSSPKYVSSNCVPGSAMQGGWRQNWYQIRVSNWDPDVPFKLLLIFISHARGEKLITETPSVVGTFILDGFLFFFSIKIEFVL